MTYKITTRNCVLLNEIVGGTGKYDMSIQKEN
jgi:hypothetical protein